jgi:hypothetical protein
MEPLFQKIHVDNEQQMIGDIGEAVASLLLCSTGRLESSIFIVDMTVVDRDQSGILMAFNLNTLDVNLKAELNTFLKRLQDNRI